MANASHDKPPQKREELDIKEDELTLKNDEFNFRKRGGGQATAL